MWKRALVAVAALTITSATQLASQPAKSLDYEFFKARVEPIFLKKRAGHTRCVVCHSEGSSNNAFRLQRLPAGTHTWSEEQSHKNFDNVSTLVTVGDASTSRLLMQPLAPEGGGNVYHSGGRQFASKNDPDWKALAQWVNGAKLAARSKK